MHFGAVKKRLLSKRKSHNDERMRGISHMDKRPEATYVYGDTDAMWPYGGASSGDIASERNGTISHARLNSTESGSSHTTSDSAETTLLSRTTDTSMSDMSLGDNMALYDDAIFESKLTRTTLGIQIDKAFFDYELAISPHRGDAFVMSPRETLNTPAMNESMNKKVRPASLKPFATEVWRSFSARTSRRSSWINNQSSKDSLTRSRESSNGSWLSKDIISSPVAASPSTGFMEKDPSNLRSSPQSSKLSGQSSANSSALMQSPTTDRGEISLIQLPVTFPDTADAPPEWATLMGSVAQNLSLQEASRQRAIYELMITERTYVSDLFIAVAFLKANIERILPSAYAATHDVFVNISDIYALHTEFLAGLENSFLEQGCLFENVGPHMLNSFFKLHICRLYCVNIPRSTKQLERLCSSDPVIHAVVYHYKVRNLPLNHILIEPMQRLTRYPLLLDKILESTPKHHKDRKYLCKARDVVRSLLDDIEKVMHSVERQMIVVRLRERLVVRLSEPTLDVTGPTSSGKPRILIKHGVLSRQRSKEHFKAYLFNDMLLLTQPPRGSDFFSGTPRAKDMEVIFRRALFFPFPCQVHSDSFTVSWPADLAFAAITVRAHSLFETRTWITEIAKLQNTRA